MQFICNYLEIYEHKFYQWISHIKNKLVDSLGQMYKEECIYPGSTY